MDKWTKNDFMIIKNRVTSLTEEGLKKVNRLHYMEIPEGVEIIGAHTFRGLVALNEVYLPSTLEVIGEGAFRYSGLRKVYGGENVFYIHEDAFRNNFIKSIKNFKNAKFIGKHAFSGNRLEEFYFSKTLEKIETKAFSRNNFKEIDLSETKDLIIFSGAFSSNLIKKVILGRDTNAEKDAFLFNEIVEIKNGNINDFEYVNINIIPKFEEASFSNLWTKDDFKISYETFDGLTNSGEAKLINLKSITFPTIFGVRRIGKNFFYDKAHLKDQVESVYICEGVEIIEESAFEDTRIKCVHFPNTLKEIRAGAFHLTSLTHVKLPAVENIEIGAFMTTNIEVLDMKDSKITRLDEGMFSECYLLKEVILPDTLEDISFGAFRGNESLKRIVIPENVQTIRNYAFIDSRLEEIVFKNPENLKTIGIESFKNTRIKDFPFNDLKNLKRIDDGAFRNTALKNIEIDNPKLSISENLFSRNNIKTVKLNVKEIKYEAFAFSDIQNIEIVNCENVEGKVFFCSKIKNVEIKNLKELDVDAFEGATTENMSIPEDTKII